MNKYDRKAIYIGRRLDGKGKPYQVFEIRPERKQMCFSGVKGVYIGHTYECTATTISGTPKRLDDPREDNAEWDAADALVTVRLAERRAEARIAKAQSPALKRALEAIRPLVRGTRYLDREALIRWLADKSMRSGE